jgi:hypothetical protein
MTLCAIVPKNFLKIFEWKHTIDLFNNRLNYSVIIYDATNQNHSQRMAVIAVSPVRIRHALECFYSGVDMFNHNTPLRSYCYTPSLFSSVYGFCLILPV